MGISFADTWFGLYKTSGCTYSGCTSSNMAWDVYPGDSTPAYSYTNWNSNEPNDSSARCIRIRSDNKWWDMTCSNSYNYMCETKVLQPTSSPTRSPTRVPTPIPTSVPTRAPTSSPTAKPTHSPTATPTRSPTFYGFSITTTNTNKVYDLVNVASTFPNNGVYRQRVYEFVNGSRSFYLRIPISGLSDSTVNGESWKKDFFLVRQ